MNRSHSAGESALRNNKAPGTPSMGSGLGPPAVDAAQSSRLRRIAPGLVAKIGMPSYRAALVCTRSKSRPSARAGHRTRARAKGELALESKQAFEGQTLLR